MPLAGVLPHIRSGRLRALGVSGKTRSATLPDVPTFTEAGIPFEFTGWLGIFAPAAAPRERVEQIRRDIAKAIVAPDLLERWPAWATSRWATRQKNSPPGSPPTWRCTPR